MSMSLNPRRDYFTFHRIFRTVAYSDFQSYVAFFFPGDTLLCCDDLSFRPTTNGQCFEIYPIHTAMTATERKPQCSLSGFWWKGRRTGKTHGWCTAYCIVLQV